LNKQGNRQKVENRNEATNAKTLRLPDSHRVDLLRELVDGATAATAGQKPQQPTLVPALRGSALQLVTVSNE
jgi:hypothetical protein